MIKMPCTAAQGIGGAGQKNPHETLRVTDVRLDACRLSTIDACGFPRR